MEREGTVVGDLAQTGVEACAAIAEAVHVGTAARTAFELDAGVFAADVAAEDGGGAEAEHIFVWESDFEDLKIREIRRFVYNPVGADGVVAGLLCSVERSSARKHSLDAVVVRVALAHVVMVVTEGHHGVSGRVRRIEVGRQAWVV